MLGIIGGMGVEAGKDFQFSLVKNGMNASLRTDEMHPCRVRWLNGLGESPAFSIADSAMSLFEMGATKVVMACNTAHAVYDDLVDALPSKYQDSVLHLVNNTVNMVKGQKALWLGTTVLAHSTDLVRRYDISVPSDKNQEIVQSAIWAAKNNQFSFSSQMRSICNGRLVVAGCTEMPLILRAAGVQFVDPAAMMAM